MQVTVRNADLVVIDRFLSETDFDYLWRFYQDERFRYVNGDLWIKAFRLADGNPLWGDVYTSAPMRSDRTALATAYPSGKGVDCFIAALLDLSARLVDVIGRQGEDWDYFFTRPYLYPKGAGLPWHTDGRDDVAGAYVYYAHPEWNANWGAELLIDGSGRSDLTYPEHRMYGGETKQLGLHLDWSTTSAVAQDHGVGTYVIPKPNRLVVIRRGVLHKINPVSEAAGDRIRASLTGFFLRND